MTEAKRTISPEDAQKMLQGHESNFELIRQSSRTSEERWDYEIGLLQRRVAEQFE